MDNEWSQRLIIAGVVLLATLIAARVVDRMIARRFSCGRRR